MTELTLIQRWQAGEAEAFEELYSRHAPTIYRLGWAMLQHAQAAEDVVQETFLRAHRARRRFDPGRASFGTWLYQIALNYCRSDLRRKRLLTVPWGWLRPTEEETIQTIPGPETDLLHTEYRRTLWQAVQSLSRPLKEVIILHYYLEMPAVEIAAIIQLPAGTVYSRLHHARQRLLQKLSEQGITSSGTFEAQNAH